MLRNEVDAGVKSCQLALDTMLRVLRDPDKVERSDHYQVAVLATELAATSAVTGSLGAPARPYFWNRDGAPNRVLPPPGKQGESGRGSAAGSG
jgi:hypothetical protein